MEFHAMAPGKEMFGHKIILIGQNKIIIINIIIIIETEHFISYTESVFNIWFH